MQLKISLGHYSDKGRKAVNQDFYGAYCPELPQLNLKGIAVALADGISSSEVSHVASQAAVTGFLADYFCTPETWSVKKSVQRVLMATNSWLHAHTRQSQYRFDKDRGYVCTFSALVLKAGTAHLFHVGDSRIYRLRNKQLEQLTDDHRLWVSEDKNYLSRALGIHEQLEIDYQALSIEKEDIFILATDGVYEFVSDGYIVQALLQNKNDLHAAAKCIAQTAYNSGSDDNLTIQIVAIDALPAQDMDTLHWQASELPHPPLLDARMLFDGYTIVREVHASSRSHVYLAIDNDSNSQVILKTPSIDLSHDAEYLERFLLEDWIARRINSPHVLKPCTQTRPRQYLYIATELIEGQTLAQWMIDHPRPDLETVRQIVEQIGKGLQAFHRLEMLHQDLRPQNIMIDASGTVKIIDFGSTHVAGLQELAPDMERNHLLGTAQYTAPEYFLGEGGTVGSDLFSLGVIAYQMLSGQLPFGLEVAKARSRSAQLKLNYRSILADDREIPAWIDDVLKKAVHPNPYRRYQVLSEFIYDLRHPNPAFQNNHYRPIMQRNPVLFWQCVALVLALTVIGLLIK